MSDRKDFDDMTPEEIAEWARRDWAEGLAAQAHKPAPRISDVKRNDYPHWKVVAYEFHTSPGKRVLVDRGNGSQVEGRLGGVRPAPGQDVLLVDLDGETWACTRADGEQWSPKPNGNVRVEHLTVAVLARGLEGPGRPEKWALQTNMEGQP